MGPGQYNTMQVGPGWGRMEREAGCSSIGFSLGEMTVKLHPPSRIRARKDSWEHWGFTLFSKGVKFKSFLRYWPGWMKSWLYEDPLPWQGLARKDYGGGRSECGQVRS